MHFYQFTCIKKSFHTSHSVQHYHASNQFIQEGFSSFPHIPTVLKADINSLRYVSSWTHYRHKNYKLFGNKSVRILAHRLNNHHNTIHNYTFLLLYDDQEFKNKLIRRYVFWNQRDRKKTRITYWILLFYI